VGRAAALLDERRRVAAAGVLLVAVLAWYELYDRVPDQPDWADIAIVGAAIMPAAFALVWLALPLRHARWAPAYAAVFGCFAVVLHLVDVEVGANFCKLAAMSLVGFWFLRFFERLSWVVAIASVIPLVDAVSVWRGPTHHIVTEQPRVFSALSVAFPAPAGDFFALGLPDILFFALFLAAADRWALRVWLTWALMVASFTVTIALAVYSDPFGIGGLPALPGLSIAFLLANADLISRRRQHLQGADG
jgi:hypothetical protein